MRILIFTLLFITSTTFNSFALDFYGLKVMDRDAPSSFMRKGITGYHPTIIEIPGAPAATYGFNQGDIILSINSKDVRKSSELNQFTTDKLSVLVFSGSERKILTINRLEIETKKAAALINARKIIARASESQQRHVEEHPDNSPTVVFDADYYERKYGTSIKAPVNNSQASTFSQPVVTHKPYVSKLPLPSGRFYSPSACESDHWVQSVSSGGQIVTLEDGSIWKIDAFDAIDSILWLPTDDIVICDDKLINTDDNEAVSAIRIH